MQSMKSAERAVIQSVKHTKDTEEQKDPDRSRYNDCDHNFDDPLGMDIEDSLPDTLEEIDKNSDPETFSKWLDLNGKQVLKTSVVAILSSSVAMFLSHFFIMWEIK